MKVLLLGGRGQLGSDLHTRLEGNLTVVAPPRVDIDITHLDKIAQLIGDLQPNFVINCAAFHKVEECDRNADQAFEANAVAVRHLARCCERSKAVFVHMSTDYVFGGKKSSPYLESDAPDPVNVYGVSKVAGEQSIPWNCERYFIVRTSGLFGIAGSSGKGGNFVELMLTKAARNEPLRVVADQIVSPTWTVHLADRIVQLLQTEKYGIYHLSSEGETSWYGFAKDIVARKVSTVSLSPVSSTEFQSPVKRPAYSVLCKARAYSVGVDAMPHWSDGLQAYLAARGQV